MTVAHIPFKSGMDESVDPRQAPPGTLTLLKNGVFVRGGEIRKRNGMTAFPALDTSGAGMKFRRLFTRGDSLCAVATSSTSDTERVYSYVEALGRWAPGPETPEFGATWFTPTDSLANVANPDVVYASGMLIYTWRTGDVTATTAGQVYISILEAASGTVVVPPYRLAVTGLSPRIIKADARCIVAWQDWATANLYAVHFDPLDFASTVTVPASVSGAGLGGTGAFDMSLSGTDRVAWAYTLGGDVQILQTSNTLAVTGGPWALGAPGVTSEIGTSAYGSDRIHVVYNDAAGPTRRFAVFNLGTGLLVGDAALPAALPGIGNGTGGLTPGTCLAIAADQAIVVCGRVAAVRDASTGLAVGNAVVVDGPVVGRPFRASSGRYYCVVAVQRNDAVESVPVASPMLVELPLPNTTGATLPCVAAGIVSPRTWGDATHVAHVATDGTSYWGIVSTSLDELALGVSVQHQTPVLCKFTPTRGRTVTILGGLCVSSNAVPWTFDGAVVSPVGFTVHGPNAAQNAVGGLTLLGSYIVSLVYERFDSLGILHRSAPVFTAVTLTGGNNSILTSRWYLTTAGTGATYIHHYITENGGTLSYLQSVSPTGNPLANDQTAGGYVAYTFIANPSMQPYNKLLYTTGGVLPDNPPPGFLDVCVHRDRLWGVSGDQRTIWFSKRMSDQPKVFPGFHETQTLRHESDVVAIASHEGMLLILAKAGLFILDGEGPPATGFPSDYGPPRRIPSDVGCMTPHSVVNTSTGTFFQGSDGRLYRVNGATLGYVGKPVEEDIAAYPSVRAAVLCESAFQVRFVCMNTAGTAGIVLVFDMLFNQWSRFEYHAEAVHGAWWRGKFVAVLSNTAFYEDATTFYDGTTNWVYLELVTAWMSFTSPTGWQRVRRVEVLGEYRGPHKFYLELSCDYSASWLQSCLFDQAATLVNQDRVTVHVGSQNGMSPRHRAIRIRLRDDPRTYAAGETGEGARWSGLGLDVLQQEGVTRHGAAKAKV